MQMIPVVSSAIAAVGYDIAQNILHIQFNSGQTSIYQGISVETYDDMMSAASIGSFYHKHIKNKFNGVKENADASTTTDRQEGA